jgi:hypothetical protein
LKRPRREGVQSREREEEKKRKQRTKEYEIVEQATINIWKPSGCERAAVCVQTHKKSVSFFSGP